MCLINSSNSTFFLLPIVFKYALGFLPFVHVLQESVFVPRGQADGSQKRPLQTAPVDVEHVRR